LNENIEMRFVNDDKQIEVFKGPDVVDQLEKLQNSMDQILQKLEKVGASYELSEITASVGGKCGILVFEANGSIELKWTKIKK
jgi:hypothetical protein